MKELLNWRQKGTLTDGEEWNKHGLFDDDFTACFLEDCYCWSWCRAAGKPKMMETASQSGNIITSGYNDSSRKNKNTYHNQIHQNHQRHRHHHDHHFLAWSSLCSLSSSPSSPLSPLSPCHLNHHIIVIIIIIVIIAIIIIIFIMVIIIIINITGYILITVGS